MFNSPILLLISFHFLHKECNVAIFGAICIMRFQYQCQYCTSFWLSWLNKCSGAITWCWGQWHHITKKSCCISFNHLDLTNWMVPLITPLACVTDTVSMALHDQKSYVAPHLHNLDWINAVVPLMMPFISHNNADASGIISPKSYVVFHFDCLDWTNGLVSLMTLLPSCDTDTSISGMTC